MTGFNIALELLAIPNHNQVKIDNFINENKGLSDMGYIAGLDHFGSVCFDGKLYV